MRQADGPDHETIPTAVFSQPEIGTVGLTEEAAGKRFDRGDLQGLLPADAQHVVRTARAVLMKLVVDGENRRVLGAHVLGPDAGELAQVLGIAVRPASPRLISTARWPCTLPPPRNW